MCATLAVEAAEEKLVDATEQAINLMRSVLENPEPIKNLHALLQAQQAFYAEASEAISSVLGEVEEAGTAAEADWRCVLGSRGSPVVTLLLDPRFPGGISLCGSGILHKDLGETDLRFACWHRKSRDQQ